jgi:F-type H+-transporting ATPase subunit c
MTFNTPKETVLMRTFRSIFYATLSVLMFAAPVLAQAGAAAAEPRGGALLAQTGAIAVAIAALGGALGDGRAIAAACEGTARNPAAGGRIFTMMLLGLALIETLVLFTFAAAYLGL